MYKRIISIILAIVVFFGVLPEMVFKADIAQAATSTGSWVADLDNSGDNEQTIINDQLAGGSNFSMAEDTASGALYVGWTEYVNSAYAIKIKEYKNGAWTYLGGTSEMIFQTAAIFNLKLAVVNGELYAAWLEFHTTNPNGTYVHVKKYDAGTQTWTAIDGGDAYGLQVVKSDYTKSTAQGLSMVNYKNSLYIAFSENQDVNHAVGPQNRNRLMVGKYSGTGSDWTFKSTLNDTENSDAYFAELAVGTNDLYVSWTENVYNSGSQANAYVMVKKYNETDGWRNAQSATAIDTPSSGYRTMKLATDGNDCYIVWNTPFQAEPYSKIKAKKYDSATDTWSDIDGGGYLNYDDSYTASCNTAVVKDGALYVSFSQETAGKRQIRIKKYDIASSTWSYMDDNNLTGGMGSVYGLNYDPATKDVYYSGMGLYNGELFFVWSEDKSIYVKKYDASFPVTEDSARLSSLIVSNGMLQPAFSKEKYNYTALVANNISTIKFRPKAVNSNASLYINEGLVQSGTNTSEYVLKEGSNNFTIKVVSERGALIRRYYINMIRMTADNRILITPQADITKEYDREYQNGTMVYEFTAVYGKAFPDITTLNELNRYAVGHAQYVVSETDIYEMQLDSALKFDLSAIPNGYTSASLVLHVPENDGINSNASAGSPVADLYATEDNTWTEDNAIFPDAGNLISSTNLTNITSPGSLTFDLKGYIDQEYAGDKVASIILSGSQTEGVQNYFSFSSREDVDNAPYLDVAMPVDAVNPTCSDKKLTIENLSGTSIKASWTKATDNTTSQAKLQYILYYSTQNNLDTIANIEANGIPVDSYASDISTATITGVDSNNKYYLNVIVIDENGNKTAYTQGDLPKLTAGQVGRTSDTMGSVKFTSDKAGTYYYAVVEDGALVPTINTSSAGTVCIAGENTITNPTDLTAGEKDIYIMVKDVDLNVSNAIKIDIPAYVIPTYTITYDSKGGNEILEQIVNENTATAEPTEPSRIGYTFEGWYTDSALSNKYDFSSLVISNFTLYAKWTINQYTISFNSNGGSTVADEMVDYNGSVTEPIAPTITGYTFEGWYTDSSLNNKYNFASQVTSSFALYAKWSLNSYTISFHSDGGSLVDDKVVTHFGKVAEPTDPTKTGYTFWGWYTDSSLNTEYDFTTTVTAGFTLYAKWNINNYTVSFNSNGGSMVADKSVNYIGTITAPTVPTRTGYVFAGWYTDSLLTNEYNFTMPVITSFTLYAKWTINTYTVTFNSDGGSPVDDNDVNHNETVTEPTDPTKTGYTFGGWYTDSALSSEYIFTTLVTSDFTLYAKWTINSFTVSFDSNGGSVVEEKVINYNGTVIAPTVPTRIGYIFEGWFVDSGLNSAYDFETPITTEFTLFAKWSIIDYTVTFNSNGGSTVADIGVKNDAIITAPEEPTRTGYTFAGWYTDNGLSSAYNFTTPVTSSFTLYAKWTIESYTILFNSDGGSTVADKSVNYNGTITAPTAPTKTGYSFAGWYADSSLSSAYNFATQVTSSFTLYAKWTINSYTVSFNSNGGSTATDKTVNYNGTITAPTVPTRTGHKFEGWYTDSSLSSIYNFATQVTSSFTLYAKWTIESYTVSFNSNEGSEVADYAVNYNGTITEPTEPTKTGYTFEGWYSDNGLSNKYDFTTPVTSSFTVYAKWSVSSFTISFHSNGGSAVADRGANHNDTIATPEEPTRVGYAFAGWFTDSSLSNSYNFATPVTSSFTLYARWSISSYTVSFNSNGGSVVADKGANHNGTITAPEVPTRTGYAFAGWYTDSSLSSIYDFATPITKSFTLHANWSITSYTVSFNSNGGSAVAAKSINYNKTVTALEEPTKAGYTFAGWYTDSSLSVSYNLATPVTTGVILYAKWVSNNASLKDIHFDSKITLSPKFSATTLKYKVLVDGDLDKIVLYLKGDNENAKVYVKGKLITTDNVTLSVKRGDNSVSIKVIAEDGKTVKNYQVVITRLRITYFYLGKKVVLKDGYSVASNDNMMTRYKQFFKAMGLKYKVNSKTGYITVKYKKKSLKFKVNEKYAYLNGKKVKWAVAPFKKDGQIYISTIGVIKWFGGSRTTKIKSNNMHYYVKLP